MPQVEASQAEKSAFVPCGFDVKTENECSEAQAENNRLNLLREAKQAAMQLDIEVSMTTQIEPTINYI